MRALIFLAHGSRNSQANIDFINFADDVAGGLQEKFATVQVAFLEFAEPNLEAVIQELLLDDTVHDIAVFPFFLHRGNHVAKDIPAIIDNVKTDAKIEMLAPLGESPMLKDLVINLLGSE